MKRRELGEGLQTVLPVLMEEKRDTISSLSRRLGIDPNTIRGWINGHRPRNLDDVRKVSEHYGVPFYYLIFGHDEANNHGDQVPWTTFFEGNLRLKVEMPVKEMPQMLRRLGIDKL